MRKFLRHSWSRFELTKLLQNKIARMKLTHKIKLEPQWVAHNTNTRTKLNLNHNGRLATQHTKFNFEPQWAARNTNTHTKLKSGPQWVALIQTHEFTSETKSQNGYRQKGVNAWSNVHEKNKFLPRKPSTASQADTNSTAIRSGKLLVIRLHKWFSNEHQNVWIITLKWWNTMVNSWNKSNNQRKFNWYLPNKFGWNVFCTRWSNTSRLETRLGRGTNRLLKQMWHEWNTIWLNYRARTIGQERNSGIVIQKLLCRLMVRLQISKTKNFTANLRRDTSNVRITPQATGSPPKKRWKSDSLWRG